MAADVTPMPMPMETPPTRLRRTRGWDAGATWTIATLAAVIGGGVVRLVATGTETPAPRRSAILEALEVVPAGHAAWLVAAEHRQARRRPVVRIVRQLRQGQGTVEEAISALLGKFQGPPAPQPEPAPTPVLVRAASAGSAARGRGGRRRDRDPPQGVPACVPPYLWSTWPRPTPPVREDMPGAPGDDRGEPQDGPALLGHAPSAECVGIPPAKLKQLTGDASQDR